MLQNLPAWPASTQLANAWVDGAMESSDSLGQRINIESPVAQTIALMQVSYKLLG